MQHLIPSPPDAAHVQALFQQWRAVTLELGEVFATLMSDPGKADVGEATQRRPNARLRRYRKMHNWTQTELADELYHLCEPEEITRKSRGIINTSMVSRWERGAHISLFWQKKLCELFHTTPDHLGFLEEQQGR